MSFTSFWLFSLYFLDDEGRTVVNNLGGHTSKTAKAPSSVTLTALSASLVVESGRGGACHRDGGGSKKGLCSSGL